MKLGFYGNNTDILGFAKLLVKNGFKIDTLYFGDVQACVEAAVELGARACFDLAELVGDADVIIISAGDENLRKAVLKMEKYDLTGKLLCAESASATCDVMDDAGADAVATVFVPDGRNVYIEGKGSGFSEFKRFLSEGGISLSEINLDDKARIDLAMFYAKSGISTLIGIARELMGDTDEFDNIIYANVENALVSKGVTGIVPEFDIGAIRRYNENARGNNLAVFQTLVLKATELSDLSADEKDRIKSIIIER